MVGVAQSAERLVVVQKVAGSIPVTHPTRSPRNPCGFRGLSRSLIVSVVASMVVFGTPRGRIGRRVSDGTAENESWQP